MSHFKTAAVSAAVTIFVTALLVGIYFRFPIYFAYKMASEIPERERKILYHVDHRSLAANLRKFAAERKWNNPDRRSQSDFFYGDDSALPAALRDLEPSWVQIKDDHIDFGYGVVARERSLSFGISVWREGLPGSGTKELEDGVWFYSEDGRVPSRFSFP